MNAPLEPSAVAVTPVVEPSTNKVTVLPASAVPLIVGVVLFIGLFDVVIIGFDIVVSSVMNNVSDVSETFPAASVALAVI